MHIPTFGSELNATERHQLRILVVKDAVALASIFVITILLAIATYFLFQSYKTHRGELADRWFARGQKALKQDQPLIAIDDLHSALLYASEPKERQIEVALASALASAGKIQEATAYFNTLWEAEPGNGEINVQLARLSASSGNEDLAKRYYHAAIYGNWEGDGYLRRRDTRLELVRYLISRGRFDPARSELLVAAGNAPSSDLQVQGLIAGLLVEDHSPADALALYQQLAAHAPNDLMTIDGAAQTAYALGNYQLAHHYLLKAVSLREASRGETGQPATPAAGSISSGLASSGLGFPDSASDEEMLRRISRIIVLDPSPDLPPAMLAARLLGDREIARQRFRTCVNSQALTATVPGAIAPTSKTPGATAPNSTTPDSKTTQAPNLSPALTNLINAWAAEPKQLTAEDLSADSKLQKKEIQLIDQTEKSTLAACGTPSGDDAILLRLAQVPSASSGVPDHE